MCHLGIFSVHLSLMVVIQNFRTGICGQVELRLLFRWRYSEFEMDSHYANQTLLRKLYGFNVLMISHLNQSCSSNRII